MTYTVAPLPPAVADLPGLSSQARVAYVPGGYGDIGGAIAVGARVGGAEVAVSGRSVEEVRSFRGGCARPGTRRSLLHGRHTRPTHRSRGPDRVAHHSAPRTCYQLLRIQREERIAGRERRRFRESWHVNLKAACSAAGSGETPIARRLQARVPAGQVHVLSVAGAARHARPRFSGVLVARPAHSRC